MLLERKRKMDAENRYLKGIVSKMYVYLYSERKKNDNYKIIN